MDVGAFCRQSHVLVVAGKGGVGKTTMVAAIARMAADAGLAVLVVELEGRSGIADAFGHPGDLDYGDVVLSAAGADGTTSVGTAADGTSPGSTGPHRHAAPGHPGTGPDDPGAPVPPGSVHARLITPDQALMEYLGSHGLGRVSKRLLSSGVVDVVAGAIPGIRDILVLGKVKQLEQSGIADLILVDAPATGHAMTFLSSASGLVDAARGGPVRTQATEVVAMLSDPVRCQVALVTLPEEMPVNEVVDAAYRLEDEVGVSLGPVIVNGCYPPVDGLDLPADRAAAAAGISLDDDLVEALDAARQFRHTRRDLQQQQIDRLAQELPLPQLFAPFLFSGSIGPSELDELAHALAAEVAELPEPGHHTSDIGDQPAGEAAAP